MKRSVTSGRDKKLPESGRAERKSVSSSGGIIMLIGAAVCMVYLMTALSGTPASEIRLDDMSKAVSAKISENEAVAVFLGLDAIPDNDSVYVMAEVDDAKSADVYIDSGRLDKKWSLWGYLADTLRGIFAPVMP